LSQRRILFVTRYHHLRYTGGAELQCWLLAREFQRRGWEAHYVSENDRTDAPHELDGVKLHYLPESPKWLDGNRKQFEKIVAEIRPDVVYNRVFSYYTWLAMSRAPRGTVKIWAAAASSDATVFGSFSELYRSKSFRQLSVLVPQLVYTRYFAAKGVRSADVRLAQHYEQQRALSRAGVETLVIRNSFAPVPDSEVQNHTGRPVVLWVGSVKVWKQPEKFIELARRCKDLCADFIIAGEVYEQEYRSLLDKAAKELPNFKYAGFVPLAEIDRHFSAAHIHVKTSLPLEGFPNTFVQAWLRGVPVVSLGVDPDRLLSRNGFGFAVGSMDELEQRVRELLESPELRREIGGCAREFAQKEFDLQANVDKLEELIREKQVAVSPLPEAGGL